MQPDSTIDNLTQIPVNNGIVVLSGYGITVNIDKGFLFLKDGLGVRQRTGRYFKATSNIKRLVIHGQSGVISLAALKWLLDAGAGIIQIGWDGEIILASGPIREKINLRRSQFLAMYNDVGVRLTVFLLKEKLLGQLRVMEKHAPGQTYTFNGGIINCADQFKNLLAEIDRAKTIKRALEIEGIAASVYWKTLSTISLQFQQKEINKIPEHWKSIGPRHSLLNSKSNYNATNPANAILNYLYALLFAETRLRLLSAGLDPVAGVFHADTMYRDSFVYDVMDAVRADVDDWLLCYIRDHFFSAKEFYEKKDGSIRLTLKITPILAETVSLWSKKTEPVIRNISQILGVG